MKNIKNKFQKTALLGVLVAIGICFNGTSNVFASDESVLIEYLNSQYKPALASSFNFFNPFAPQSGCEPTNPSSSINCNENPSSEILHYDRGGLWGNNGYGVVFKDTDDLIDENPRLRTAARGERIKVSVEINTKRYYDGAETDPIRYYEIGALVSPGLVVDQSTMEVKVNGEAVTVDNHTIVSYQDVSASSAANNYDFDKMLFANVPWYSASSFIYPDNAIIELSYVATVSQSASSNEFNRGAYSGRSQSGKDIISVASEVDFYSKNEYQANVVIDGNILIRHVDSNGAPVAGAKYSISNIKANQDADHANRYYYAENGAVSEFVTGSDGTAMILGVPLAEYTIQELSTPAGHQSEQETIIGTSYNNAVETQAGGESFITTTRGSTRIDLTDTLKTTDDGTKLVPFNTIYRAMGFNSNTDQTFVYDNGSGTYRANDGSGYAPYIRKTSSGYHIHADSDGNSPTIDSDFVYDESIGQYIMITDATTSDAKTVELSISGANATITGASSRTISLIYENSLGCYTGTVNENMAVLCPTNDGGYFFEGDLYQNGDIPQGAYFARNIDNNKYYVTYFASYIIKSVSNAELVLELAVPLIHNDVLDHYYLSLGSGTCFFVNHSASTVFAAEFVFRDANNKTGGDPSNPASEGASVVKEGLANPENIVNPQTSDAILKILVITLLGIVPSFILRNQLVRRAR